MAGGVCVGRSAATASKAASQLLPGGILGFIQHFMTGIFIIKIMLYAEGSRQGNRRRHLRAGIVRFTAQRWLRRAASTAGTSRVVGSRRLTAASEFRREVIIDAVKRIPAQPAHR